MNAKEFLTTIFGDSSGYLFLSTLDDEGHLTNHKPFKYPENINAAATYAEMRTDEDVWFSPMLYSVPRRVAKTVSVTPVIYADTDMFDPRGYLIAPSFNIESSPGRTQSYWLLDDVYTPEEVSTAARAIALAHARKENGKQAGVDPSGWDLTQLLRLPGSTNNKYKVEKFAAEYTEPYPVFVRDGDGDVYSLEDVIAAYDPTNLPEVAAPLDDESLPDDLPEAKDVLRKVTASSKLRELYNNKPRNGQDWSDTLYLFLSECFRSGFTPEEALVAGWHAACNKYKRDGRPMEHLWKYDVSRAYADPNNRPRPTTERVAQDAVVPTPKDEGLSTDVELALLTPEEHKMLTRTVIDEYVEWAETKTDAPAPYHVAGALTVMSCVLGEWAVADPQFGEVRLGLSFVIMGETTETRKSTARNLMKKLLRLTENNDYSYLLTSDTTPESLLDALSEREDLSSLYDRDEAQQLIEDVKGGKGYLKGFFETLNELYDGKARGRLRATKKTKEARVNFVQYLMGIRSQIQENLELRDFASGWGPRNIYVRGESPPRNRNKDRLRQGSSDSQGLDAEAVRIAMIITNARDYWVNKQGHDRSQPYKMYFDDDAWERITDLEWDLKEYFKNHPRFEILKPCIERMTINAMKVAVLLAMVQKRDTVALVDVLNTRYLAAQWVEDLVIMVEGVNESMEQRTLDNIEKFVIEHDGLVTYAALLKWSIGQGIKKRDLLEYIETLEETNVIKIVEDGRKKKSLELVDA